MLLQSLTALALALLANAAPSTPSAPRAVEGHTRASTMSNSTLTIYSALGKPEVGTDVVISLCQEENCQACIAIDRRKMIVGQCYTDDFEFRSVSVADPHMNGLGPYEFVLGKKGCETFRALSIENSCVNLEGVHDNFGLLEKEAKPAKLD